MIILSDVGIRNDKYDFKLSNFYKKGEQQDNANLENVYMYKQLFSWCKIAQQ